VLAPGIECDACNAYAGRELEPALVAHEVIALWLQS
jgi:hypothetical protein